MRSLEFGPLLLITLCAGLLLVLQPSSVAELSSFKGHGAGVTTVAVSQDGAKVLSGSLDTTIRLWDFETGRQDRAWDSLGHKDIVWAAALSPDGTRVLSGGRDQSLKFWDARSASLLAEWTGHGAAVTAVAFSPDGAKALSASADRTIKLWDLKEKKVISAWIGHTDWVTSVVFSLDGKKALSGSRDKTIRVWDVETGEHLATWKGHKDFISSLAVSPDGKRALSGSLDQTIKLWDVEIGEELATWTRHRSGVTSVAFSPDGKHAVSASYSVVFLWDIAAGKAIRYWHGHYFWVWSVAFTPDGLKVVSAGEDAAIKIWDVTAALNAKDKHGQGVKNNPPRVISEDYRKIKSAGIAAAQKKQIDHARQRKADAVRRAALRRKAEKQAAAEKAAKERKELRTKIAVAFAGGLSFIALVFLVFRARKKAAAAAAAEAAEKGLATVAALGWSVPPPETIVRAAASEVESTDIAAECVDARKTEEFIQVLRTTPLDVQSAFAPAFLRAGDYETAVSIIEKLSPGPGREADILRAIKGVIARRKPGAIFTTIMEEERLQVCRALLDFGIIKEAVGVLSEESLVEAISDPAQTALVARAFDMAGLTAYFMESAGPDKRPSYFSAYARAFHAQGRPAVALTLLKRKSTFQGEDWILFMTLHRQLGTLESLDASSIPEDCRVIIAEELLEAGKDEAADAILARIPKARWRAREYYVALRLLRRNGSFGAANALFIELQKSIKIETSPGVYYCFALFCEKTGRFDQAQALHGNLVAKLKGYKDASARMRRLGALAPRDLDNSHALVNKEIPPRIAARFELLGTLGAGNAGVLFLAKDFRGSRNIVMKRVRPAITSDPALKEKFLNEVRALTSPLHRNILPVYDIFEPDNETYLIYEHFPAETLTEILAYRGQILHEECALLLRTVCRALSFAHRKDAPHLGLKPSNVLINAEGLLKVADFGQARRLAAEAGTPYTSPEQHSGGGGPQSDVYALGVMAYEMLTGSQPFPHDLTMQKRKAEEAYKPLPETLPAGLRDLVKACLKADPGSRPKGPAQVEIALFESQPKT